ncbi:hypothetical protein ACFXJO_03460 [Streptomyces lavendulae]|uniref:hypothetical protein n=1 Tax=Streptomyces lavendulae TaxID=1914 RepID=UPI00368CA604
MSDRLEWADTTSFAELLFPGVNIGGATVDNGEIAVAFWTGRNGIALSGPPQQLADRLEQAALIARAAAVLVQEPLRHIPDGLDPWLWITLGTDADSPAAHANTKCRTPGITATDPRRVTCGHCIAAWNACWSDQYAIPAVLRIPADTVDCRIGGQLPAASVTWIDEIDEGEELPGDDAYDWIDTPDTTAKD